MIVNFDRFLKTYGSGLYRDQEEIVRIFVEQGLNKIFRVVISKNWASLETTKAYKRSNPLAQDRKKDALSAMLAASNFTNRGANVAELVGTVTENGMVAVLTSEEVFLGQTIAFSDYYGV